MKVAHWTAFNRSGMNRVAESIHKAELEAGVGSILCNPQAQPGEKFDHALDADVHVSQADGFTRAEVSALVSGNTSAATSVSTVVSTNLSTTTSAQNSLSTVASANLSASTSRSTSLSLILSVTTSTANSG